MVVRNAVAQHPLEGRAPTGDGHEILVPGFGLEADNGVGQVVHEAHFGGAGIEQARQDLRGAIAEKVAEPGEQRVRVTDLRRAAATEREELIRRRRERPCHVRRR